MTMTTHTCSLATRYCHAVEKITILFGAVDMNPSRQAEAVDPPPTQPDHVTGTREYIRLGMQSKP